MCLEQEGAISTLSCKHLKLVNQFTYLIYWKRCHHTPRKGMDRQWQVIEYAQIRSLWLNKTGFLPSWGSVSNIVWMYGAYEVFFFVVVLIVGISRRFWCLHTDLFSSSNPSICCLLFCRNCKKIKDGKKEARIPLNWSFIWRFTTILWWWENVFLNQ